jgi:hypothetical protein
MAIVGLEIQGPQLIAFLECLPGPLRMKECLSDWLRAASSEPRIRLIISHGTTLGCLTLT